MASPNVHESSLSDSDSDESVVLLAPTTETPKRKQASTTENGMEDTHPAKKKRNEHAEEVGNNNISEKTRVSVAASTIPDPVVPKLLVNSKSPILLLLCGVQGSGKSTFCQLLLQNKNTNWIHLSQDTIRNGKPGKREAVEAAAYKYLEEGKPVIIDRMHLTPEQRSHFISVAKGLNVPVHAVFFNPPSKLILDRVKNRTNHPGGVQGTRGVFLAKMSLKKMMTPDYEEGFAFITTCTSAEAVNAVCASYHHVGVPDT
eukprot:scaffold61263_cov44-Attheya_sp.AAC.2